MLWLMLALAVGFALSGEDKSNLSDLPKPPKPTPDRWYRHFGPNGVVVLQDADLAAALFDRFPNLWDEAVRRRVADLAVGESVQRGPDILTRIEPPAPAPPQADGVLDVLERGPYTIVIQETDAGVAWAVYLTEHWESFGDGAAPQIEQHADQLAEARDAAKHWIDGQLEGVSPGIVGQPVMGGPGVQADPSCTAIAVTSIHDWLAWAVPRVEQIGVQDGGRRLVEALFFEALPGCVVTDQTRVRGQPLANVVQRVDRVIQQWRDAELVSVEEPQEVVAARIVASSVPKRPGRAELRHRAGSGPTAGIHLIVVDEHPSGVGWRWQVWRGVREPGQPLKSGAHMGEASALNKARAFVDEYDEVHASLGDG